jgi:hypothetical protein
MPSSPVTGLALPIGIAIGGACIGAGLFFGLRARPAAAPMDAPAAATSTRGVASTAPVAMVDVARDEVTQQLASMQAMLRDKCWAPAVARAPTPDHGSYSVESTFDANGMQLARVINPATHADRGDVILCLTGTMPTLSIAPQGTRVHVVARLTLP